MRGDDSLRHLDDARVAVHVIGMTVGVDHVRHDQPLFGRPGHECVRRVPGIDQKGALRIAIAEEITEVPIAAGTDLFEDKLHAPIVRRRTPQ